MLRNGEELFLPFALTISLALGGSLLVAISIVPSLSHTLFKKQLYGERTTIRFKEQGKIVKGYKRILEWTLNHKIITSLIAITALAGSLMLTPLVGFSFLGNDTEKVMILPIHRNPVK